MNEVVSYLTMIPKTLSFLAGIAVGLCLVFLWVLTNRGIRSAFFQSLLPNPPQYADVGGTIMALHDSQDEAPEAYHYYRDAGCWGVLVKRWRLFWFRVYANYEQVKHMDGRFVRKVSQAAWAKDNEGYIGNGYKDDPAYMGQGIRDPQG